MIFPDESVRLAALHRYHILGTPAEADFDEFTRMASQICETPIALVSLVDAGRQWFQSKVGLAVSETGRDQAFGAHAIQSGGLFEVPDTLEDEHFRDNPLVTADPNIRFYAGVPLVTPDGLVVGSLCVMDRVPRKLTTVQREMLTAVSRQMMRLVELRRTSLQLRALNEQLELQAGERTASMHARERHFRSVLQSAHDAIISIDSSGLIFSWNPGAQTIFGYSIEEAMHQPVMMLIPARLRGSYETEMRRFLSMGTAQSMDKIFESYGLRKDGSEFPMEFSVGTWSESEARFFSGILRDITARKQAEEALRQTEVKYRSIFDNVVEGIFQTTPEGRYLSVNPALVRMYGYASPEEMMATLANIQSQLYVEPNRRAEFKQALGKNDTVAGFESQIYRKDGSTIWISENARGVRDPEGSLLYYEGTTEDITARKLAEAEIEKLALVARETDNAVILTDAGGRIEWVNAGFNRITGYQLDEVIGQKPGSFLQGPNTNPETVRQVRKRLAEGKGFELEMVNYSKTGREYWVELSIQPLHDKAGKLKGFFSINSEITARKQTERQTLRTQRLEGIGTLAGGVAHDLNNALTPILMATELMRTQYPDVTDMIDIVERSAQHAADMVRQLVTFAKGVEGERLLVKPLPLLKEMEKIIKSSFPKTIELRTDYAKQLFKVLGDSTQLHQVLLNLCVNARDAMPRGGTLTISAENTEIDATYSSSVPEARPGRYVVWRVADTGSGIPPEILDRIFEPFFSTKSPDKGTGLGLSTVVGIVKSHGGFVRVYSVLGQGTTFAVYLPASDSNTGDTSMLTKADTAFRGQGEAILVVDDEAGVRQATRAVLTALNFKVLTAVDGTDAFVQVAENLAELKLVITDLHMPNMDGLTFVRVLRHMLPDSGIIVASGRLEEREANEFATLGVRALLNKPFTQEKLVEALKTVLQK